MKISRLWAPRMRPWWLALGIITSGIYAMGLSDQILVKLGLWLLFGGINVLAVMLGFKYPKILDRGQMGNFGEMIGYMLVDAFVAVVYFLGNTHLTGTVKVIWQVGKWGCCFGGLILVMVLMTLWHNRRRH